jgi:hypothetical protein
MDSNRTDCRLFVKVFWIAVAGLVTTSSLVFTNRVAILSGRTTAKP